MAVNKVVYDGATLVDLTGDTVTADNLAAGVKATGADGKPIVGLLPMLTIDAELNDTSTNPIQNKAVNTAIDTVKNNMTQGFRTVTASIPTKVSDLENDAGYVENDAANTWGEQQAFKEVKLGYEKYGSPKRSTTGSTPTLSLMQYEATGAFTLDLSILSAKLQINESTVFTAYITSAADYPLTITKAGTIKYIGSASDVAITSAGLLLNILLMKDARDTVTSIVQASNLS